MMSRTCLNCSVAFQIPNAYIVSVSKLSSAFVSPNHNDTVLIRIQESIVLHSKPGWTAILHEANDTSLHLEYNRNYASNGWVQQTTLLACNRIATSSISSLCHMLRGQPALRRQLLLNTLRSLDWTRLPPRTRPAD